MKRPVRNGGFTLLETLLAFTLFGIIAYRVAVVMSDAVGASNQVSTDTFVDDHAQKVLRQIAVAIMSSDRQSLDPATPSPLGTDDIQYRVQLGIEDGVVIWSDPEEIALADAEEQVYWSQNPETADETRVVWTNLVSPFLEGEIPNGMDDNGNGLIDEKGLSFTVDRNAITIRLTLDRVVAGRVITKTVETTVTCRNVEQAP